MSQLLDQLRGEIRLRHYSIRTQPTRLGRFCRRAIAPLLTLATVIAGMRRYLQ